MGNRRDRLSQSCPPPAGWHGVHNTLVAGTEGRVRIPSTAQVLWDWREHCKTCPAGILNASWSQLKSGEPSRRWKYIWSADPGGSTLPFPTSERATTGSRSASPSPAMSLTLGQESRARRLTPSSPGPCAFEWASSAAPAQGPALGLLASTGGGSTAVWGAGRGRSEDQAQWPPPVAVATGGAFAPRHPHSRWAFAHRSARPQVYVAFHLFANFKAKRE